MCVRVYAVFVFLVSSDSFTLLFPSSLRFDAVVSMLFFSLSHTHNLSRHHHRLHSTIVSRFYFLSISFFVAIHVFRFDCDTYIRSFDECERDSILMPVVRCLFDSVWCIRLGELSTTFIFGYGFFQRRWRWWW